MTAVNFAYWLQGYFEISGDMGYLKEPQVRLVRDHIKLVKVKEPKNFLIACVERALDREDWNLLRETVDDFFDHVVQTPRPNNKPGGLEVC